MQLLLKDTPVLDIQENGTCHILDADRLPFALRRPEVTFADFVEWASNRTLSIGRSHAKEILNILRLSQTNRYAVCKACRGLSLQDSYWIRQADGLYLHKVGKYEIPADEILTRLEIPHIHYAVSADQDVGAYLSDERRQWIGAVGEVLVHSGLFTDEDTAMVTFEDFALFHSVCGRNPYEEAFRLDPAAPLKKLIKCKDYLNGL